MLERAPKCRRPSIHKVSMQLRLGRAGNLACLSNRLVVFAMSGVFYDIVRCRLAVAEVPVLILRFQSRFTRSRAAPGAAMPGGPGEPQPTQQRERRLEFRECAGGFIR